MRRIKRNPTVVPARVRSGAGVHADAPEKIYCGQCGMAISRPWFCSTECEMEANAEEMEKEFFFSE